MNTFLSSLAKLFVLFNSAVQNKGAKTKISRKIKIARYALQNLIAVEMTEQNFSSGYI